MRIPVSQQIRISAPLFLILMCASAWGAGRDTQCTPRFPLEHGVIAGWLGADAAYSILLPGGADVWIFGDTLYGKHRVVHGNAPVMVHNSIGISTCSANGHWHIRYFIRKDATGHPVSFFTPQHPHAWYWAMDGFHTGHDLWITLLCVRPSGKPSALGFETCGSSLARIRAPGPDPLAWKIKYYPLVADGAHAYPSATTVIDGKYVDLFAQDEAGTRPLIASRIPLKGLNAPEANLEYLARNGKWLKGFDPKNARAVMTPGISELSIRYHPRLKRWIAVMFVPEAFSSQIELRTAPTPIGPWSQGKVIYTVPVMQPKHPGYDKDTFCYAGKEHPEFEHGDLVFTYVCNTLAVQKLVTNLKIYFPNAVRIPMPTFIEARLKPQQQQIAEKRSASGKIAAIKIGKLRGSRRTFKRK
jgi:hypothetical protein